MFEEGATVSLGPTFGPITTIGIEIVATRNRRPIMTTREKTGLPL
jgi:hypothetical protein